MANELRDWFGGFDKDIFGDCGIWGNAQSKQQEQADICDLNTVVSVEQGPEVFIEEEVDW